MALVFKEIFKMGRLPDKELIK
jgi:hypothetical protein